TSAAAVTVKGRVDVSTKLVNSPPAGPKLYAADVPVIRQDTAITRITLARADASTANAVVVFAVAGAPVGTSPPPVRAQLAATRTPDGKISIQSSHAGRLQSSASPAGPPAAWTDEGAISQTVTLTPNPNRTPRFYRVVSQ
ncbi:MAG TPA: hypothetical protein VKY92_15500, partial [Verrucomicrobiae bacterium]|nr:hypothetical protein [Verrucomicrobiae bacterium]